MQVVKIPTSALHVLPFLHTVVSYEVTVHTGDVPNAGTDAQIFIKAFGANGCSSDIVLEKQAERFERGHSDLIKVCCEFLYVLSLI